MASPPSITRCSLFEKRFSNGVSALFSYTKSKLISESQAIAAVATLLQALGTIALAASIGASTVRWMPMTFATFRRQRLWELPIGKDRLLVGNADRVVNGIIGGWQLNGIWTIQTGTPLVVRGTNNFTGIGYPNIVGNPTLPSGDRTPVRWFNTEAFANPADFTIGNAPRTLPATRAPGLNDTSFSLFKTFKLKERIRLETRWELFNALNTVNYNAPNTTFQPSRPAAGPDGHEFECQLWPDSWGLGTAPDAVRLAVGVLVDQLRSFIDVAKIL